MAETYYLPRKFDLTSPWAGYIRVTDKGTCKVIERIQSVDLDKNIVEIQNWDEETSAYKPVTQSGWFELSIAAGAPKAALEFWKIPLGKDLHVEVTR